MGRVSVAGAVEGEEGAGAFMGAIVRPGGEFEGNGNNCQNWAQPIQRLARLLQSPACPEFVHPARVTPWPFFTEVTPRSLRTAGRSGAGTLQSMQGCASGIENTNYFVSTDRGDYVLTLFERLSFEQLPFYLNLMHHLADKGIPVPAPQANAQGRFCTRSGQARRRGDPTEGPQPVWHLRPPTARKWAPCWPRCTQPGKTMPPSNRTCAACRGGRHLPISVVIPHLNADQKALINGTGLPARLGSIGLVPESAARPDPCRSVPRQRDVDGTQLSGFFDFYFAGCDTFRVRHCRVPERLVH